MPAAEWWKNHHHESDKLYLHALHLLPPCHRSTHHFDSNDRRANCRRTEEKVTKKKAAQRNETHTRDFQVDENRWSENRGKRDEKSQLDFASCQSSRSCVSLRCEKISYPRSRHVSDAAGVLQQGGISASNWERSLRQKVWDFDTSLLFLQD